MENIISEDARKKHNKRQNKISVIIIVVGAILAFLIFGPKDETQKDVEITIASVVETLTLGEGESQVAKLEKNCCFEIRQKC